MRYKIQHITTYRYDDPVNLCYNLGCMIPRESDKQLVESYKVDISPLSADYVVREDYFGNKTFFFSLQQSHEKLNINIASVIKLSPTRVDLDSDIMTLSELVDWVNKPRVTYELPHLQAKEYILDSPLLKPFPALYDYAMISFKKEPTALKGVNDLMKRIFTEFEFKSGFTTVTTPLTAVFENKKGVCQDFSQMMIACLRSVGVPARYVSGYIETLPPEGEEKLFGTDASHAWVQAFFPNIGWVDFDPTNDQIPFDQHVTVAWGRDYSDVTPLKGVVYSSGPQRLEVSVDMRKV